jgi:hypothetical protein
VADVTTRHGATPAAVERWLLAAVADAERRGLSDLKPLLEGLAQATVTLRSADWNDVVPARSERTAE